MLPLLKMAGDRGEHELREAIERLADQFGLTPEEGRRLLPSGTQPVFANRVGWARTYLKKAGLLESTGRGRFRITRRGLDVLRTNPQRIDAKFLKRFPEFVEFQRARPKAKPEQRTRRAGTETPEEILESTYKDLRLILADDLLERLQKSPPDFFEKAVVDLLLAMGYGGSREDAGQVRGGSGDEGIDGVIKEDKLGLDVVYIQAKRWQTPVGRPDVQAFAGSLEGARARKGVMISTSQFTPGALDYVKKIEKKIILIDGRRLAQLMIDHGVGVSTVATYDVKRVDTDYFGSE
jgi:restriction system protein